MSTPYSKFFKGPLSTPSTPAPCRAKSQLRAERSPSSSPGTQAFSDLPPPSSPSLSTPSEQTLTCPRPFPPSHVCTSLYSAPRGLLLTTCWLLLQGTQPDSRTPSPGLDDSICAQNLTFFRNTFSINEITQFASRESRSRHDWEKQRQLLQPEALLRSLAKLEMWVSYTFGFWFSDSRRVQNRILRKSILIFLQYLGL